MCYYVVKEVLNIFLNMFSCLQPKAQFLATVEETLSLGS